MERYEFVEYDVINDLGEWVTVTHYELIEWDETETDNDTEQ